MSQLVVTTKEQLKRAVKNKEDDILIQGEVLKYYKAASKLKKVGKISLGIAVAGVVAAPFTGGLSTVGTMGVVAAAATSASLSTTALITFIVFMGVGLLFAIFSDYEEIETEAGLKGIKLKLKKSKRK